jgi:hypothetical protein
LGSRHKRVVQLGSHHCVRRAEVEDLLERHGARVFELTPQEKVVQLGTPQRVHRTEVEEHLERHGGRMVGSPKMMRAMAGSSRMMRTSRMIGACSGAERQREREGGLRHRERERARARGRKEWGLTRRGTLHV